MKITDFLKYRYVDVSNLIEGNRLVSGAYIYVNPFNYFFLRKNKQILEGMFYRVDGIYLIFLLRLFLPRMHNLRRQSFDMTSLAPLVFDYCSKKKLKVFVAGGKKGEAIKFIDMMSQLYSGIDWVGSIHGYYDDGRILTEVGTSDADVVLLGLGNVRQEKIAGELAKINSGRIFFTCGAFISQTANSGVFHYYPGWINRFNLRWAYRFFKEPHVIKRVLKYYPVFFLIFLLDSIWG